MDTSDIRFVFKNHGKKHKSIPSQFMSVADGVIKRLETNLKYRKSCRLTEFDSVRDLSREASPAPPVAKKVDEIKIKQDHRRLQLEKWKEEKEKKKKEALAQKKKPFVASVAHAPLHYVPPPPPPSKALPSTSGRVTRSQTSKSKKTETKTTMSFAPKNAIFRPPQLNNEYPLPQLQLTKKRGNRKMNNQVIFDPKPATIAKNERVHINIRQPKETTTRPYTRSKLEPSISNKSSFKGNVKPLKSTPKKQRKTPRNTIFSSLESNTDSQSQESFSDNSADIRSTNCYVINPDLKKDTKKTPRKSLQKSSAIVTPKIAVPKSESSSEEKLRSPKDVVVKTPEQMCEEPMTISPCVTLSRGKDNARREMKKKLKEGLLDEDSGDIDNVKHFRRQLESEIARMTQLCDTWDEIYENCSLPEFVQELVLGSVGQARLLMSSKLQQFSSLVDKCAARDAGAGLITPADLQGFWDMVFIQIEKVELRFKELEELRAREWAEERKVEQQELKQTRRTQHKKTAKPAPTSRIRDMIAAARKAKKDPPATLAPSDDSKTFEAGFFTVRSPVRSPAPQTPKNKVNLLKDVLSSEARKASASKNSASYAMLRASLIGKNVDIEGVAPLELTPCRLSLSSINLNATPARSILKSAKTTKTRRSKKSIKAVLFNQSDTEEPRNSPLVCLENGDSGLSSMDAEKDMESKENTRKKALTRQDATETSPVMTRNRRKSLQTPLQASKPARAPRQKKVLEEIEIEHNAVETPRRTRRKKNNVDDMEILTKPTPKRSSRRSKVSDDLIDLATPEPATRKRTNRSLTAI